MQPPPEYRQAAPKMLFVLCPRGDGTPTVIHGYCKPSAPGAFGIKRYHVKDYFSLSPDYPLSGHVKPTKSPLIY